MGCDPPSHPTRKFIQAHLDRYLDPDAPRKRRALEPVPRGGGRVFMGGVRCRWGVCDDAACVGVVSRVPARSAKRRGVRRRDRRGGLGAFALDLAGFVVPRGNVFCRVAHAAGVWCSRASCSVANQAHVCRLRREHSRRVRSEVSG